MTGLPPALISLAVIAVPLFGLIVPAWTLSDAMANSSDSALRWTLVSTLPVVGIAAYLAVGRDATDEPDGPTAEDLPEQFREGSAPESSVSAESELYVRMDRSADEGSGYVPEDRPEDE